jgi:O-antigen/teichoic acid export membrane protein
MTRDTDRGRHRDTRALALGSAVSGLLAYLVFALTTRGLGAEAAGPVSVLWSYWAFAGAAFTFPLQHWIARTATAHGERAVRDTLPQLSVVLLAASLLLGLLAWLAREPLFHRDDLWFPAMVVAVTLGSSITGVVRGALSARGHFVAVAWSLVAENGLRCAAAGALLVADSTSVVAFGLCLVAGHLVMALWPSAMRFGTSGDTSEAPHPFAFLAGASLAQLIGQCVLTGGPVVLALAGGSQREVTTLFAALALFRAPYMLALGMVAQLTTRVTALLVSGRLDVLDSARRWLRTASVGLVVLAAVGGAWLGPPLLRLVFGDDVRLAAGPTAVVAVGCTVAVVNLVVMVGALAQGRATAVARAWVVSIVVAAVTFAALASLPAESAVVWCFLVAEVVAFVGLSVVEQRGTRTG